MNKTLVYIAVGLGVLYLLSKKGTKKLGSAIESSLKPVEPIKDDPNMSLSDLQKKSANEFIEASKRRKNFFVVNEQNEELIKKYFDTIDVRQRLLQFRKMSMPKLDKKIDIAIDPKLEGTSKEVKAGTDLFFDYDLSPDEIKRELKLMKKSPILQARRNFNFDDGL